MLYPMKRKIETKYRLPLLNWVSLPPTQIAGTVFTQLDDETILEELDFSEFEEAFKNKRQNEPALPGTPKSDHSIRKMAKESLLDPTRSQNIAIARRKVTCSTSSLKQYITT